MKKSDVQIVSQLRVNGRMPLTVLSRKTGLPVSTIHERLKEHVAQGLLRPTMLLGFGKLGFATRAWILLGVEQSEKEKLYEFLKRSSQVNSLFRINNGWNALMDCVFKDMYGLENFLEQLENKFHIRQKQVHYVLDEFKVEQFFADEPIAELLMKEGVPSAKQPLNTSKGVQGCK